MTTVVAYLDPGSGSMVLQLLVGGIAGFAVSLKMLGKRMLRVFTFWKRHDEEASAVHREPKKEGLEKTSV